MRDSGEGYSTPEPFYMDDRLFPPTEYECRSFHAISFNSLAQVEYQPNYEVYLFMKTKTSESVAYSSRRIPIDFYSDQKCIWQ
jgi:hypothetical protein